MTRKVGGLLPGTATPTASSVQPHWELRSIKQTHASWKRYQRQKMVSRQTAGPSPTGLSFRTRLSAVRVAKRTFLRGTHLFSGLDGLAGPLPAQSAWLLTGGQAGVSSRTPGASQKKRVVFTQQSRALTKGHKVLQEFQALQRGSSYTRFLPTPM